MDSASLIRQALWERADLKEVRTCIREFAPDVIYAFNLVQFFPSVHAALSEGAHQLVYEFQDALSLVAHLEQAKERAAIWSRSGPGLRAALRRGLPALFSMLDPAWGFVPTLQSLNLDHAVCCSDSVRRRCLAAGLPIEGAAVIYNPVNPERFRVPRIPSPGPLRVLFVGRLVVEKGGRPHGLSRFLRRGVDRGR
jgi:glycosyltransferase involved in cell wall biosynthesis